MISKHIDLIAIGCLLFAFGAFSGAKHVVVMSMSGPVHYFRVESGRDVRMPAMPRMPAPPKMPSVPHLPQLQRD